MLLQNRSHKVFSLLNGTQGLVGRDNSVAVIGKQAGPFDLNEYLAAGQTALAESRKVLTK